jgi:hypothetical protein
MIAGAIYGSVSYGAAGEHSDVEVIVVTDEAIEEVDEYFFDESVMVECAVVQADRLVASAGEVPWNWGIKADAYRHQLPVWDPDAFFEGLRAAALSIPAERFERALEGTWWWCFETRGKFLNALAAGDVPRALNTAWQFAYAAAMRIALRERKPYESMRTVWTDVSSRGYRIEPLLGALADGASALAGLRERLDEVWSEIGAWGRPSSASAAP